MALEPLNLDRIVLNTAHPLIATITMGEQEFHCEFNELLRCDFPVSAWEPIPVEIPPGNSKSWYERPASKDNGFAKGSNGLIHLPLFRQSNSAPQKTYDEEILTLVAATPVLAIATRSHHIEADHSKFVASSVLLVWASRIAVVISLDGTEGVSTEGAAPHEWHLNASASMKVETAIDELLTRSKVFPSSSSQSLYVAPNCIGQHLLGQPTNPDFGTGSPWLGEWRFDSFGSLAAALSRFRPGLDDFAVHVLPSK